MTLDDFLVTFKGHFRNYDKKILETCDRKRKDIKLLLTKASHITHKSRRLLEESPTLTGVKQPHTWHSGQVAYDLARIGCQLSV